MRSLNDTIARLAKLPRGLPHNLSSSNSRLVRFAGGSPNPGNLNAWIHVPETAAAGAPLVIVLHGCTQNAAGYDESSGWSRLADQHGFVVLYPEQQRANNPNLCFNWYSSDDAARGKGESLSIREMVAAVHRLHNTDPERVFVTGLSAGGAMAATMLATYPDVFAGGAVIAGLPFGVARSVPEAFDRMRGHGGPEGDALPELVRAASRHSGPWPTLSVWHGSEDHTVDRSNAAALVEQWRTLHGAPKSPSRVDQVHGYPHRVWRDPAGRAAVEEYVITGLGHGTPLDTAGTQHDERSAPYMLEAGISSTRLIADFWGIVPEQAAAPVTRLPVHRQPRLEREARVEAPTIGQSTIQDTIESALRRAGLMK